MSKFLKTIQENYPTTDADLLLENCMVDFKNFLKSKGIKCKTKGSFIEVATDDRTYKLSVQPESSDEDNEVEELASEVDPTMTPILKKRKDLVTKTLPKIKKRAIDLNKKLESL
jgi:hypothetical protein